MSNEKSDADDSTNNNRPGFFRSRGGSGNPKGVNRLGSSFRGSGRKKIKWNMFASQRKKKGDASIGPELQREWGMVQDELSDMERSVETGAQLDSTSAITTRHWVKNSDCSACSNQHCKRTLWAMSKHHCRKCGKIFCAKCVQFRRRLSTNADYDPNGWLYKVCEQCFGSREQEMGHSRRWTYDLQIFRNAKHKEDDSKLTTRAILRTCKNLVEGFQANCTSGSSSPQSEQPSPSGSKNLFSKLRHGVTNAVKHGVPDWQKPQNWVSEGTRCQCCNKAYGKLDRQRNCRICGQLVCKAKSSKDLLLFTPDKSDQEELGVEPRWAVIKVIGCPEFEPDHRLYIRVCHTCRELLKEIQVSEQKRLIQGGTPIHVCSQELEQTYRDIMGIQTKIDASVPEFQKLIDGLEIETGAPASLPPNRNNMQLLAKYQGDLSDHLAVFMTTIMRLKKLNPQNRTQVTLVKNLISCKFSYYTETNGLYRKLRKQLSEVASPEVLSEIQSIVDRQAINSACLALNQIAFECLHLCIKYDLDQTLAARIKQTAEVCDADLRRKVESQGEQWEEHDEQIKRFVKLRIKGDPENNEKPRHYIRPSRRRTKKDGAPYVEWFLKQRVLELSTKIRVQLVSRSADRSFKSTKQSLEQFRDSLVEEQGS